MNATEESREFQAEVKQLLDIVVNSLYSEREIFLRELISNAADALERIRYLQLGESEIVDPELALAIDISVDEQEGVLAVSDTGVGMTREELIEDLGTIAHSGSKSFIKHLAEGNARDLNLIGQFGVGFYSVFMVADEVTVTSRSYKPEAAGCKWVSDGGGGYTVSEVEGPKRGTRVALKIKEQAREFLKAETVKEAIKKYSNFVAFPIHVNGERVNTIQAIWTKNKSQVNDAEYTEFYRYLANSQEEPLLRLHFSVDAPLNINAVLFVPQENLERFGFGRVQPGVSIYARKILIQERSEEILPEWMRFVRGVVDSEEFPLNISRETMQDTNALVSKLRRVITGRFIKFLAEQAERDKEKYQRFWERFGVFVKEGVLTDAAHKQDLADLLRFMSSKTKPKELISLKDYTARMQEGQESIYYLFGPDRETVETSPYMEAFRQHDLEVIYSLDPLDEYVLTDMADYEGKKLISTDQAEADLTVEEDSETGVGLSGEEREEFGQWLKKILGDRVQEVRASKRLTSSPCMVLNAGGLSLGMQRMVQRMQPGITLPAPGVVLEINTRHPVITSLDSRRKEEEEFARTAAEQMFDGAMLAAGLEINPRELVKRMHAVLERALE